MSDTESSLARPPSRVLISTDCVGGIWSYTLQLARELTSRGCEVLVAAIGPAPTPTQFEEIRSTPNVRFTHAGYRLEWMSGGCEDLKVCRRWFLDLEQAFCPDIIHSNSYSVADAPFCAPVLVVAHSCVYSWWHAVHGTMPPTEWTPYKNAVEAGLRSATAVVAPTRSMLDSLASNYGVSLPAPHLIHNGLQMPEIDFGPKQPMILAAGRIWDESKNFSLLDDVASSLRWPIRIAGAAESPDGRRSGLANAQHLGELSQSALHRMMCDAAVFAHPALYEPFGLAILEAAQRGCALVLSDIPSLRELWEHAAVFCPPRDRAAWVTALETISNSADLHSELSLRARSRAAQFTTEQMVGGYQHLYRRLTTDRGRETYWERAS